MIRSLLSSAVAAAGLVLFAPALPAEAAGNPQITVTRLAVVAGKLVIAGTATTAGKPITIQGTAIHTTSTAQKTFAFNVNYRTNDCQLTLVTDTGSLDNLMIGSCAPGFIAKGAWAIATQYALNDIVTRLGQTYRAKNASLGKAPESNVLNWELFAAKGVMGLPGTPGTNGTNGINGTNGTNGTDGADGADGTNGTDGAQGPSGVVSVVSLTLVTPPVISGFTQTEFNFVGTTSPVALDGAEQLTGTVSAMLTSSGTATVQLGICYQSQPPTGTPTLFASDTYQSITILSSDTPKPFQASATTAALPAGSYVIGACAKHSAAGIIFPSLTRNNGWVMVTRSP